jgi:hypothetical protein
MWMTPDGAYLYQIYGNASRLMGYAVRPDGALDEITSATIPYNSPMAWRDSEFAGCSMALTRAGRDQ